MDISLITLRALLLAFSAGPEVKEGWADGTCALWAVNAENNVVCLTDQDRLFRPHASITGLDVNVDGLAIGVYANEKGYLDGGDLIRPMVFVNADPHLGALRDALADAFATP